MMGKWTRKVSAPFVTRALAVPLLTSWIVGLLSSPGYAAPSTPPPVPLQGITPYQTALADAIDSRNAAGLPVPSTVTFSIQTTGGEGLGLAGIESSGPITVTATTVVSFDGPEQAGYEQWPSLVVSGIVPDGAQGTLAVGDYSEMAREEIEAQLPGIWEQYEFGYEPRRHTITETFVIDLPYIPLPEVLRSAAVSTSDDILLGFSYSGPHLDYTIEDSAEICFPLDVCVTLYRFKAGFELDWMLGLRLPAEVSVSGPDQMVQGESYEFTTSLTPLDWSASDYAAAGVAAGDGNEFVLRLNFFIGVEAELIGVDLCPGCSVSVDQDASQSFPTPLGAGAVFPIPSATIPIYEWDLTLFAFSVGLMIDPDLSPREITANWGAVSGSDCMGDGSLTYAEPNATVSFGPVTACNLGPTDQAQVELADFEYWFDEFLVTLRAVLDFNLFGFGVWHAEPTLVSFDLDPLTGDLFVTDYVECDFAFNCTEVGPDNSIVVSSTVIDETPPTTALELAGTAGDNGWWVSDVVVTLDAVDGPIVGLLDCGSGVDFIEYSFDEVVWNIYSGSFTIATEGVTTLYYRSTDLEGNVETAQSHDIKIDKTPPTLMIISPQPATYPNADSLTVEWVASDAVSGVASEAGDLDGAPLANGQVIDLSQIAIGSHTVTVEVVDGAGHATVQSVTFFVSSAIDDLVDSVEQMCDLGPISKPGICKSLLAELRNARAAMERGRCGAAQNLLRAFIHQVDAQSGKSITRQAHDLLVASARSLIRDMPGCSTTG